VHAPVDTSLGLPHLHIGPRNLYGRDSKFRPTFKSGTEKRLFSVPLVMTWCSQNAPNCTDFHLYFFKKFPRGNTSGLECCTGQVMPSRARPFLQRTLPCPSRSHQSRSHYRPAPVHLCPDPVPVPQTELTPSRRDSLNFTTPTAPTADRCRRCGGLFFTTSLLQSVKM